MAECLVGPTYRRSTLLLWTSLHGGLPPITDRCESLHRGRSRLCFKRPLARPTQPLLPEPACRADGEGVEKWDALCTSVTPLTSPGKECEGGVMTFKAQW